MRGVEAMRNLATAAPDGVKRNSGSSVRLPMTVMVVSPAMTQLLRPWLASMRSADQAPTAVRQSRGAGPGVPEFASANVRPDDLGTQHGLVESQLAVQLGHRRRLGLQVDDGVDALGLLIDLERQAPAAPDVELLHRTTRRPDHVEVRVERRGDGALLERRIEDHHDLVMTQDVLTSSGLAATVHPWQEVVRRSQGRIPGMDPTAGTREPSHLTGRLAARFYGAAP